MARYKRSPKDGRTVKLIGFYIDNDLVPLVNKLANKSRFINDLIRKYFSKDLQDRK